MDVRSLIMIYRAIEDVDIDQIKIENKNIKIRMVKGETTVKDELATSTSPYLKMGNYSTAEEAEVSFANIKEANPNDICANHVGFFSRFDTKTGKQYIKLRDVLKKSDVVGAIIVLGEAHEVIANKEGKIVELLVEEGQPVEYGQPLMRLEGKEAHK